MPLQQKFVSRNPKTSLKYSSGLSGWLKTKKRGKDDDQIEKDRLKAIQNRKNRKNRSTGKEKSKGSTTKLNKISAKTKKRQTEEDSDEDSFIVDDDDEVEEDDFSEHEDSEEDDDENLVLDDDDDPEDDDQDVSDHSSSEDEKKIVRSVKNKVHKIAKNPSKKNNGGLSDTDDEEDSTTFLQSHKVRTSIRPPALLHNTKMLEKSRVKHGAVNTKVRITNPYNGITSMSSKLNFNSNRIVATTKTPGNDSLNQNGKRGRSYSSKIIDDDEDDEDDESVFDDESVLFRDKHNSNMLLVNSPTMTNIVRKEPHIHNYLEDTPEPTVKTIAGGTKVESNKKFRSYFSDSNESDNDLVQQKRQDMKRVATQSKTGSVPFSTTKKKSSLGFSSEDFCDDEDEATALSWALKESAAMVNLDKHIGVDEVTSGLLLNKSKEPKQKGKSVFNNKSHSNKKKRVKHIRDDSDEDEEKDEVLAESTDENNNDSDENDNDSYIDEDAEAASSILKTANALSAQVLQNMIRWTNQCNSSSNTACSTGQIPMGMIVDGALALSSINSGKNMDTETITNDYSVDKEIIGGKQSQAKTSWISKELMQSILPSVQLADYQLIGVNWMSLLHSMKCEILDGGSKRDSSMKRKTTNVNGILADEMGLGKTVQTIAFLSWLNYSKDKLTNSQRSKNTQRSEHLAVISLENSDDDNETKLEQTARNVKKNGNRSSDTDIILPHLIVAPASVLSNWENEFHKFAPHLNVVKYHGSMAERKEMQEDIRMRIPTDTSNSNIQIRQQSRNERIDVILAPVTYFQIERSEDRKFLNKFRFEYLVVDEAHLLKNSRGTRYKSLDKFRTNHRLLLTGTPVQNSPKELMSLLCFLMPLFSKKSSSNDHDYDEGGGHDGGESMLQYFVSIEGKGANGEENYQAAYRKLKQLFSPFVLRRRKEDVLNQILPPKERRVELVTLGPAARQLYNSIIEEHVEAKKAGVKLNFENLFTQLRKAAHHPLLIRSRYRSPTENEHLVHWFHQYGAFRGDANTKNRVAEELKKFSDFDIHLSALDLVTENPHREKELGRYILSEDDLFSSAKFELLRTVLPDLIKNKGHRVLIFSGWTNILDLLTCLMDSLNLKYMRMDGQTDVSERQSLIDTFNGDPSIPVFLLSTRASGLGITLTSAQVCIMHDLDFNPFNDLQAEDRCHRIGQKQKVTVIKLVSANTVDEDVYAMQERKSKMNSAIMDNEGWDAKDAKKKKDLIIENTLNRFLQEKQEQQSQAIKTNTSSHSNIKKTSFDMDNVCASTTGFSKKKCYKTFDKDTI